MWKWPHLKSWSLIGTKVVIDKIWDPLYVHVVKGHIPMSEVIRGQVVRWAQNVKFTSFEKLEVRLEPNLVYWSNVKTFTCSWGQRSWMNSKGHVRLICKIAWKCKIWHSSAYLRTSYNHVTPTGQQEWNQAQVSICIIHKPRRQATLAVQGLRSIFCIKSWIQTL